MIIEHTRITQGQDRCWVVTIGIRNHPSLGSFKHQVLVLSLDGVKAIDIATFYMKSLYPEISDFIVDCLPAEADFVRVRWGS